MIKELSECIDIYVKHKERLTRVQNRKIDKNAKQDMLQNAFLSFLETYRKNEFTNSDKQGAIYSYVNQDMNWQARQIGRDKIFMNNSTEFNPEIINNSNPEIELILKEEKEQLKDIINQLSPQRKKLIKLLIKTGSIKNAAKAMNISYNTAKHHYFYFKNKVLNEVDAPIDMPLNKVYMEDKEQDSFATYDIAEFYDKKTVQTRRNQLGAQQRRLKIRKVRV